MPFRPLIKILLTALDYLSNQAPIKPDLNIRPIDPKLESATHIKWKCHKNIPKQIDKIERKKKKL